VTDSDDPAPWLPSTAEVRDALDANARWGIENAAAVRAFVQRATEAGLPSDGGSAALSGSWVILRGEAGCVVHRVGDDRPVRREFGFPEVAVVISAPDAVIHLRRITRTWESTVRHPLWPSSWRDERRPEIKESWSGEVLTEDTLKNVPPDSVQEALRDRLLAAGARYIDWP